MIVVSMCFKKKEEHRITYRCGPYASQIDYISVREMIRKYFKNYIVIPGNAAVT